MGDERSDVRRHSFSGLRITYFEQRLRPWDNSSSVQPNYTTGWDSLVLCERSVVGVWSVHVVVDALILDEDLGFEALVELLGVEELIA